jgi:hypothetical protein
MHSHILEIFSHLTHHRFLFGKSWKLFFSFPLLFLSFFYISQILTRLIKMGKAREFLAPHCDLKIHIYRQGKIFFSLSFVDEVSFFAIINSKSWNQLRLCNFFLFFRFKVWNFINLFLNCMSTSVGMRVCVCVFYTHQQQPYDCHNLIHKKKSEFLTCSSLFLWHQFRIVGLTRSKRKQKSPNQLISSLRFILFMISRVFLVWENKQSFKLTFT